MLPDYHPSNRVTVALLRGVVESSQEALWDQLLLHRSKVAENLANLGLFLVVDEHDGFAYIRQIDENDQPPEGYDQLPKLIRKKRLGYSATILAVILRDELRKADEADLDQSRPVVEESRLLELWLGLVREEGDEKRSRTKFESDLRRMTEIGFLSQIEKGGAEYEIRRIIKARISLGFLQTLKQRLGKSEED